MERLFTFSYRDAIIISTGEAVLGILATLLVSAAAGFMAREDNTTIAFQLSSEPLKFCLVQWELLWVKTLLNVPLDNSICSEVSCMTTLCRKQCKY